jgi:hypothetical protein
MRSKVLDDGIHVDLLHGKRQSRDAKHAVCCTNIKVFAEELGVDLGA